MTSRLLLVQSMLILNFAYGQELNLQNIDAKNVHSIEITDQHFICSMLPPVISGDPPRQSVVFLKNIDVNECKRIRGNISFVFSHIDQTWSKLVPLIENDEYSITIDKGFSIKNYSVGEICNHTIDISLSAAVIKCLIPRDEISPTVPDYYMRKFKAVSRLQSSPSRKWLQAYVDSDAEFYQVQLEVITWARNLISESRDIDKSDKRYFDDKLVEQSKFIQKNKQYIMAREIFEHSYFEPLPKIKDK